MRHLAASEHDRDWEAVQNCYPDAIMPPFLRNERGFDGLGRVGVLVAKRGV